MPHRDFPIVLVNDVESADFRQYARCLEVQDGDGVDDRLIIVFAEGFP